MEFSINKKSIIVLILWLMLFAGYNTNPQKLDFSNFLNLFHGIRAFFPILAGFLALILLLKKRPFSLKILKTPLGLLIFYTLIGIISSIFLSPRPFLALYWAISYFSVLLVLLLSLVDSKFSLSPLISLNWIVVFIITIGLFVFFLLQPGAIQFLVNGNFLGGRPYESLANVPAEKEILGMAGTRPTGLGRYAGVAALVALAKLLSDKRKLKLNWFLFFLLFYFVLIFSQAKTAILGFILGSFLVFLLKSESKFAIFRWSLFTILQSVLVGIFLFYIPFLYIPHLERIAASGPKIVLLEPSILAPEPGIVTPEPTVPSPEPTVPSSEPTVLAPEPSLTEKITPVSTLGGRAITVWPKDFKLFLKSPLIGWGFYADRIFSEGGHAHNAILHALIQTGIAGTIPFILAFIWAWIILFRLFRRPSILKTKRPFLIEIAGVLAFFTVRSVTESTGAFFGADWLLLAPLLAYLQQLNQEKLD